MSYSSTVHESEVKDIDFNTNIPIYIQIMDNIKEQLISGEMGTGDKLPSVREISKILKVNPTTIQRVYRELEHEGLTYTKRGMGSFVTEDQEVIDRMKKEVADRLTEEFVNKMIHIGFEEEQLIHLIKEKYEKEK